MISGIYFYVNRDVERMWIAIYSLGVNRWSAVFQHQVQTSAEAICRKAIPPTDFLPSCDSKLQEFSYLRRATMGQLKKVIPFFDPKLQSLKVLES